MPALSHVVYVVEDGDAEGFFAGEDDDGCAAGDDDKDDDGVGDGDGAEDDEIPDDDGVGDGVTDGCGVFPLFAEAIALNSVAASWLPSCLPLT
jgi:hypothetical protein